jgi:tetratricopeptide (TPR) repeat protein
VRSRFAQALAAGELTPLVGRERELDRALRLWKEVELGFGAAVLIAGEPGVGKSRLCREIHQLLRPGQIPVVLQCWSQVENSAFAPVIDFCNAAFDLVATDPPQVRMEKLGRLQLALEPDEVELIAAFLSLPIPEDSPLHRMPRERRKELTLELLVRVLLQEAGPEPAILVVEDLHSADPSTLKLLELLVERIRERSALALMTTRPELVAPFAPRPQLHPMALERLAPEESEALIRGVARGRAIPGRALEAVSSRAAGVPLFLEELTRSVLAQEEETGSVAELPSSLDELLAARLDRLPHRLKGLAVQCAVAGMSFSAAQVAAACEREESSLRGDLEELVDLGLLREDEKGNEPTYHFHHPLLQEAAYRSQPPSVKRERHRRFAEALQKRFPELAAAQPELLAHHLTEAGATAEAIHHWARAAELASRRSAYAEAAAHLTRALDLLLALPRPAPAGTQQELPLRIALGLVQSEYLGYSAATDRTYARALELLGEPGAKPPEEEPSLWGPFSFYFARADFQLAFEVAQRMIAFGRELRRPYYLAVGHRMAATVLFTWGALSKAEPEMERALAYSSGRDVEQHRDAARRLVMAEKHWVDPTVMALAYAAIIRSAAGQPDDARVASAGALALAEQIGHPFTLCYALTYTALASQLQHEAAEVVHFAGRAIALGREHRFLLWENWARLAFSWGVSTLGQPTRGIAQLRAALERWAAAGLRAGMPHNLGMLADMHLRAGDLEPGLGSVREALEWMERTGERSYEVELHRLHGELLRRQGDQMSARASFLRAIEVAGRQGARGLGLRAACSLARQLGESGHLVEARRLVERALAGLPPGSAPDFDRASDLLAALQGAPADRPPG